MGPLPHPLLARGALAGEKCIVLIPGEATGKIATIVGIFFPLHSDLFTGIKLWSPSRGQHERRMQHRTFKRRALQRHETRRVMIVDERGDSRWIRIKRVVLK